MYHLKLVKGLSYTGKVKATKANPDVFTEDEEKYASAMKSGYFADLTDSAGEQGTGWEDSGKDSAPEEQEPEKEEPGRKDGFEEMSVDELRAYAKANGISLTGLQKKTEILEAVRAAEAKAEEARRVLREQ